jgi:hypothetical protein
MLRQYPVALLFRVRGRGHQDDLPGLVTEAETVEAIQRKLAIMVPELLETNGTLDAEVREIPLNLIAHREAIISLRD